jgi:hypothetical protein
MKLQLTLFLSVAFFTTLISAGGGLLNRNRGQSSRDNQANKKKPIDSSQKGDRLTAPSDDGNFGIPFGGCVFPGPCAPGMQHYQLSANS